MDQSYKDKYVALLQSYVDNPTEEALVSIASLGRELLITNIPLEEVVRRGGGASRKGAESHGQTIPQPDSVERQSQNFDSIDGAVYGLQSLLAPTT